MNSKLIHICLALCALMVISCVKETEVPAGGQDGAGREYREAKVSLDLVLSPEDLGYDDGPADTKADPTDPALTPVTKFVFIEYDNDGNLVIPPIYYDQSAEGASKEIAVAIPDGDIKFKGVVISATKEFDVTIFNEVSCATLDGLKALSYNLTGQDIIKSEGEEEPNIFISGLFEIGSTPPADSYTCELKRNVAKLTFTVTNSCPIPGFSIKSIFLAYVPKDYNYFIPADSYSDPETYMSYEVDLTSPIVKGQSVTYTCYVPRNHKTAKTGAENATVKTKNNYAPDYATCIQVIGNIGKVGTMMTYYPGANMKNDFNLKSNHRYNLDINIKSNFSTGDSRMQDYPELEPVSNSYIINPTTSEEIYAISMERMYIYWTEYALEKEIFAADEALIAEVIWQDQDTQMIDFCGINGNEELSTSSFRINPILPYKGYFCFKTDGSRQGNILIGVKKASVMNDGDESNDYTSYLWSWHIWITDYNPDAIAEAYPEWETGKYIYKLDGEEGAVHRYNDASDGVVWAGMYKDKYIMDRNLGALDDDTSVFNNTLGLYYQGGRKDPFHRLSTLYDIHGQGLASGLSKVIVQAQTTIDGSVNNPLVFYASGDGKDWASPDPYSSSDKPYLCPWNNPEAISSDDYRKGIFDPCPVGWTVPHKEAFYVLEDKSSGQVYIDIAKSVAIDFPKAGFIWSDGRSGDVVYIGNFADYWMSTPSSAGMHNRYNKGMGSGTNSYGFTIRCIQE